MCTNNILMSVTMFFRVGNFTVGIGENRISVVAVDTMSVYQ